MRFYPYTVVLFLLMLCMACEKKDLMSFQLDPKVYFYKDNRTTNNDSIVYSFAVKPDDLETDTIRIPIRIMGEAAFNERKVNYSIVADKSDALPANYELLPASIPANSFSSVIRVKVTRTAELKSKEYRLLLRINNSEGLTTGVDNQLTYLIRINDFLTRPASWSDAYFGKYSATKFAILIRETGYTQFVGIGYSGLRFVAQATKNAVLAWEAEHGTTMLDENGEPVVIP